MDAPRPKRRPDGWLTRGDMLLWSEAEKKIHEAVQTVEKAGASPALTDAVVLLSEAQDRVADHMEGDTWQKSSQAWRNGYNRAKEDLILKAKELKPQECDEKLLNVEPGMNTPSELEQAIAEGVAKSDIDFRDENETETECVVRHVLAAVAPLFEHMEESLESSRKCHAATKDELSKLKDELDLSVDLRERIERDLDRQDQDILALQKERDELRKAYEAIWARCKVVMFSPYGTALDYPLEHAPAANKDMRLQIEDALRKEPTSVKENNV